MLLPSPQELKKLYPTDGEIERSIQQSRASIAAILSGKDPRLAIIIGPCSLHNQASALEYAELLQKAQQQYHDSLFLIMRSYIEKPRTSLGWKGALYDPFLSGKETIHNGLLWSRETLLKLAQTKIPLAMEFLDPSTAPYFSDLISWGFVGSRTTTSPIHRQLASSLPFAVGFKNCTDGSILNAIHSLQAAEQPHAFLQINEQGSLCEKQSTGNPLTHLVLRGADSKTNYDAQSIQEALSLLKNEGLPERVVVDCSHGNSGKEHEKQKEAFFSVVTQRKEGNPFIRAIMLESFLSEGKQPFGSQADPRISITDGCLSWESTKELLFYAAQASCYCGSSV